MFKLNKFNLNMFKLNKFNLNLFNLNLFNLNMLKSGIRAYFGLPTTSSPSEQRKRIRNRERNPAAKEKFDFDGLSRKNLLKILAN